MAIKDLLIQQRAQVVAQKEQEVQKLLVQMNGEINVELNSLEKAKQEYVAKLNAECEEKIANVRKQCEADIEALKVALNENVAEIIKQTTDKGNQVRTNKIEQAKLSVDPTYDLVIADLDKRIANLG